MILYQAHVLLDVVLFLALRTSRWVGQSRAGSLENQGLISISEKFLSKKGHTELWLKKEFCHKTKDENLSEIRSNNNEALN